MFKTFSTSFMIWFLQYYLTEDRGTETIYFCDNHSSETREIGLANLHEHEHKNKLSYILYCDLSNYLRESTS